MINKMIKILIGILFAAGLASLQAKEHPCLLITAEEGREIRESLGQYPLLDQAYQNYIETVQQALERPIEVPPPGEAGGYEHEKHKQNYREMHQAGVLYVITGDEKYAAFVRDMLNHYADLYPTLGPHPRSMKQKPGRLFHQTLNEEVWLMHAAMAYDCVYNWLKPEERKRFEDNIFRPMIHLFSVEYAEEFNRIHNHGTWAVSAVGMMAFVMDEPELIEKALYGTEKDGNGGFLQQLDLLFSPDGYYMEGPYYIRYALRPFFLFAEAIERNEPNRKIYEYRDQILKKAYYATAQTIFPNGVFPPINDASKSMDIADVGPMIANDLSYFRYGADQNLLAIAKLQNSVMLNRAGLVVAKAFGDGSNIPQLNWPSVELRDGFDGQRGGLGILRTGSGADQTMLLMKYGVHGKGHGHFDKLHFIFYDQHREVVPDYGFARWINMEPKYGGRYTKENDTFAKQTIAHNTVVVDGQSQNRGSRNEADQHWGERHFFDGNGGDVQVVSARANQQYSGVQMQRTMLLVRDDNLEHPVVIDLYRLKSEATHQYDYPIYYHGQLVTTNAKLKIQTNMLQPFGADNGYQHLWKLGTGKSTESITVTWVDGQRYYSLIAAGAPDTELLLGRIGANDPDFNLRAEPMFLLRRRAGNHLFASVLEPHGYFNEAREQSRDARSVIQSVKVVGHNDTASVIEIFGERGIHWLVMVNNGESTDQEISVNFDNREFRWQGNYHIEKLNQ
jgi:hypothetical protein